MTSPTIERARKLRRDLTPAETRLWGALRNRAFLGLKWRRQSPIAGYYPDFACKEARLIVELDGEQHAEQTDYDERRTRDLEAAGYHVIRFWNGDVMRELTSVLERMEAEVDTARGGAGPHPPTPSGRGPLPLPRPGEGTPRANPLDNAMPLRARRKSPLPIGEREGPAARSDVGG